MSDLRDYYSTGQPPLDLPAAKLAEYTAEADQGVAQMAADPQLKALMAMLPAHLRQQFEQLHPMTSAVALVPCLWLRDKMRILCVRKELAEKTTFLLERHAVHSGAEMQWLRAVQLHNGFCKTITELQLYKDA